MTAPFKYDPPETPLQVVFQDDTFLVVNKPSGLLSVPGKAEEHRDCLETRVKLEFANSLLVHRLDMDTSGLMIFALTKDAQRNFGRQFEKRVVRKSYLARVEGLLVADSGQVNLPLIVDWPNRPLQKIDHENGKSAETKWTVLGREPDSTPPSSVVRLFPKTGRSHQLRVHMLAIGHPILGDRFYGTPEGISASKRLQLHAEALTFIHPATGEWVDFVCLSDLFPTEHLHQPV